MSTLADYPTEWPEVAKQVKKDAAWRCIRCGHPHELPGPDNRLPCDKKCDFDRHPEITKHELVEIGGRIFMRLEHDGRKRQRVLTVHHLDGDKHNLAWWNLTALCQVCHLVIQAKVDLNRPWAMFEHSEWFKPYAAGWYARHYLSQDLTREETMERLDELLTLERVT